jgi:hypothetical protein
MGSSLPFIVDLIEFDYGLDVVIVGIHVVMYEISDIHADKNNGVRSVNVLFSNSLKDDIPLVICCLPLSQKCKR